MPRGFTLQNFYRIGSSKRFWCRVVGFAGLLALPSLFLDRAALQGQAQSPTPLPPDAVASQALMKRYCVGCHNQSVKTAGISVQGLIAQNPDVTMSGPDAAVWEKVLRKVSTGQMPPVGMPHPKPEAVAAFTKWTSDSLDHVAALHPNPGQPTIHRLNRVEYGNAVRDLLGFDLKLAAKLPADDTGYGFDNIGDVLSLSPILIERYMSVARLVSRAAVGNTALKPEVNDFVPVREPGAARVRLNDDLPFDSAGGLAVEYNFPVDAEYTIKVKLPSPGLGFDGPAPLPKIVELRIPVKAGVRKLAATFLAENLAPEVLPVAGQGGGGGGQANGPRAVKNIFKLDVRLDGARLKLVDVEQDREVPALQSITIAGPYDIAGPGDTPTRRRIFLCSPTSPAQESPCAHKILANLSRQAYRRPVTETDIKPLMAFYTAGRKEGTFDSGIGTALRAILVSPDFLFRVEHDSTGTAPGSVHRVSDFELASRLSFFLWSSIPDEELLKTAEAGKLNRPEVLKSQVVRMLADSRSTAFVSNFAGQWLYLRNLAQVRPDQDVFPKFDPGLRRAFQTETEMFFNAILRENRPVTDLLSANFTFLNQRLANHYKVPGVYGPQFRRVSLTDPNRGGLLGQGSILTVTSYPNRTSVVQRGKWVLENLLGSSPPPPPPDVDTTLPQHKDGVKLTMRQQMEEHRANPTCAGCHSRMDPIGFSLENYDGIGAYRGTDGGNPIDASGKLPDGTVFTGPKGLKALLITNYKDQFLTTFTEKLMTYAMGRGLEYYDEPAVRAVIRDASTQNASIPAFIDAIVKNPQFQTRRTKL